MYLGIWEPLFKPGSTDVLAPVKTEHGWSLAMQGEIIWPRRYVQLWGQRLSPDAEKIAAVVAPKFGEWTIAVDDKPWKTRFSDAVLFPVFSPDSRRVAAIVKHNNRYTIAIDGKPWEKDFDMAWDPVFSPDGNEVAAKVEQNGKFVVVLNGKTGNHAHDGLWDPVFSPDGEKLLLRCIEDGRYYRRILLLNEV
jgi:hypothetical protein